MIVKLEMAEIHRITEMVHKNEPDHHLLIADNLRDRSHSMMIREYRQMIDKRDPIYNLTKEVHFIVCRKEILT